MTSRTLPLGRLAQGRLTFKDEGQSQDSENLRDAILSLPSQPGKEWLSPTWHMVFLCSKISPNMGSPSTPLVSTSPECLNGIVFPFPHSECEFSCIQLSEVPWTVARRAPLPGDFPGKNTGVGCHSLLQGIFWIEPVFLVSPALAGGFLTTSATWAPSLYCMLNTLQDFCKDTTLLFRMVITVLNSCGSWV